VEGLDVVLGGGFPGNSLIILAGNSGTGKTVFSAQFLYRGAVDFGENGLYVSFAENRETFFDNMRDFGFDFEKLEKEGKFRYLDLLTIKEPAVPSILNMILEEASRVKARRLVIDSYSALAQAFKEPIDVRIVVHTILSKIIRGMGCTTIMIEEVPFGSSRIGFGVEEFVADGVIHLKTAELEGYRLRELEILKLRGARLKEPRLIFTLDGGFKAFPPFKPMFAEKPKRFQQVPDPPGKYSTGSSSLDEALDGGLPKGSVTLLELDEKISTPMYHLLVASAAANFVLQGRGVFVVPSSGVDPILFRKYIGVYGGTEEEWTRYTKIIVGASLKTPEVASNIIHVKGEDWKEDIGKVLEASDELAAKTGQPSLSIVGVDTLITLYGENRCEEILNLTATEARRAGATVIAIVKAGLRDLAVKLSPIADLYLRLKREHGCLLLYGVRPRTGLYAVEIDTSKGYPIPKLTTIL
jgi:KaiC/GvpD/RAD55 family RecA-like ATPase